MAASIMLDGLRPKFHSFPPLCLNPPSEALTCLRQTQEILKFVPDWLERDIIREVTEPALLYFSKMFTVAKKNGKRRPILDLSRLNRLIVTPKFKMETLDKVVKLIVSSMWGTSVDITDAYLHVPINKAFQKYFAFKLGDRTFVFLVMPFGLTTAPWAFSRVIKPIKAFLRHLGIIVCSFLDDFLILALSFQEACLHTKWTENLLEWLGFQINREKSSLLPLQKLEYLGIVLDLQNLTMSLPQDKVEKVLSLCHLGLRRSRMSRRELESLVGFLNFATNALSLGRLYLIPLIRWMNAHTTDVSRDLPVFLDQDLKEALSPWLNLEFLEQPVPMNVSDPTVDIMTDASDYGWSGVTLPYIVEGHWTQEECILPICWRELKAILETIYHFADLLRGKSVRVLSDSMTALACIRHQGSVHSGDLYLLSKEILEFCQAQDISLVPVHLRGVLNVLADQGSRLGPIVTEWSLDRYTFLQICYFLGFFPEVDLFATRFNSQLLCFVSPFPDAMALAWDARFLNWSHFRSIYVFPPLNFILEVVMKLKDFLGKGFVIAPMWPSAIWFQALSQRCPERFPLPQGYSLYQYTSGGHLEVMEEPWNLWFWIL